MTWSVWMASAALAIMSICNTGLGQTATAPIASFGDIAGKWAGHAGSHNVTLEIETGGRFTAKYAFGGERGEARLEDGTLVIPLPQHDGALQLTRDGEMLKGPGVIAGKTWMVSLARTGSAAVPD